jgi:hypothetical protein
MAIRLTGELVSKIRDQNNWKPLDRYESFHMQQKTGGLRVGRVAFHRRNGDNFSDTLRSKAYTQGDVVLVDRRQSLCKAKIREQGS